MAGSIRAAFAAPTDDVMSGIVILADLPGSRRVALIPRQLRDDEIPELRAMWWRLAARGDRLPAERGVILIDGRQQ